MGFLDLTKEILAEHSFKVDEEGFKKSMEIQRTSKKCRSTSNYMGTEDSVYKDIDTDIKSKFIGYDNFSYKSKITAITTDIEVTKQIKEGEKGTILVEETPFYATSGGQTADTGTIKTDSALFVVEDTIEIPGDKIGHIELSKGCL